MSSELIRTDPGAAYESGAYRVTVAADGSLTVLQLATGREWREARPCVLAALARGVGHCSRHGATSYADADRLLAALFTEPISASQARRVHYGGD